MSFFPPDLCCVKEGEDYDLILGLFQQEACILFCFHQLKSSLSKRMICVLNFQISFPQFWTNALIITILLSNQVAIFGLNVKEMKPNPQIQNRTRTHTSTSHAASSQRLHAQHKGLGSLSLLSSHISFKYTALELPCPLLSCSFT